jgi:hypothetical protein
MYTLRKHKKRGAEGFKDFVRNLESFPAATVKEMLQLGLIEDPVYLKWAMENRISFQYMINLDPEHIMMIYRKVPNSLQVLVMALKNSPDEQSLMAKLPEALQRQYNDEKEYSQVTAAQRVQARHKMMSVMFKLEKSGELESFVWNLPPVKVLQGEDNSLDEDGNYIQYYTPPQDDIIALKGPLEEGLRAGAWQHFYPNGELIAEGHYVDGEKAGPWKFFYPDKKLWMEGVFVEGLKEGSWKEYDSQGRSREAQYKKGSLI